MTHLPFDLSSTLANFTYPHPIRVTDAMGKRVNGRYRTDDLPGERFIRGVVLVIDTERLAFLSEGNASAGGINIMTMETLYFADTKDGETENRQSYVYYEGYKYRVFAPGFTMGNAGYNSYDCIRFMDLQNEH